MSIAWLFSNNFTIILYLITSAFIITGILLRFFAKIYLGENFSHSLRIREQHVLTTHGLYSQVRHPAYTGTLFIIIGATIGLELYAKILIILSSCIFIHLRVKKEEALMLKYFKGDYAKYILKTKRYLPYLY